MFDGIFEDIQQQKTLHFAFFNSITPIDNMVKITYQTNYMGGTFSSSGTDFSNYMQFGIVEHENLLTIDR